MYLNKCSLSIFLKNIFSSLVLRDHLQYYKPNISNHLFYLAIKALNNGTFHSQSLLLLLYLWDLRLKEIEA